MRRGVPPRAVKQGPAPTPSLPPSATPSPSSSPTSGRGSASLSTPGSRPPASPQRGSGNGKYVTPSARRSGSSNEDEYSLARDENYQKKIFEGKDQVQTRRPNPNRFSHNQISSINSLLTSGYQKTPIASQKSIDNSGGNTPMNGSEKTTVASQKMSTDDAAPNRNSEKTPSPYHDGGDSSLSWTRGNISTPTLTDLENTVHVDCRVDKLLRVARDYALPEELGR